VANSLAAYIDGAVISNYREGDKSIPLVVRGEPTERQVLTALRNVSVFSTSSGRIVPLTQIADVRAEWVLSRIKRYNQERTITVSAKNQTLTALQLLDKLRPTLATLKLPGGYRWEIGGELEKSKEAQANLFKNMPVCFALILALLVWQFGSFRRPAIILLTIPLTLIGAVIGLLVMRADFGFMVILGFLSLAGIIINNGIVLVDRIDIERDEGKDPYEAIVAASLARFRPILMTTMTTILGLTPLIVTVDPLFFGMAVVIAFGLFVATVFTLGVVPVLYALFFRVRGPAAQS
jgi:multidrug efflux pump subunit AcrB